MEIRQVSDSSKAEEVVYIYALVDPRTNEECYIGATKNVSRRLVWHKSDKRGNTPKDKWIKDLKDSKLSPIIKVLEECTENNKEEREVFHIVRRLESGIRLLNSSRGGNGAGLGNKNRAGKLDTVKTKEIKSKVHVGENNSNSKITEEVVKEIRKLLLKGTAQYEIAVRYGISKHIVYDIKHNRRWKHVKDESDEDTTG